MTREGVNHFNSLAFNPDGKYLASGGDEGGIRLWNVNNGQNVKNFMDHPDKMRMWSVAFSPDGKSVAAAGGEYVKIWRLEE